MIEEVFQLANTNEQTFERVIQDEYIHYLHMIYNKNEGIPEHFTNASTYITVLRGKLSLGLGDQDIHVYEQGSLLKIPTNIKININNSHDEVLEIIIVKAPAPPPKK